MDDIADDLSYVGIPAGLHSAYGADYWDQFASIAQTAIPTCTQP